MNEFPRIGITCDVENLTDRRGRATSRFVVSTAYVDAVVAVGGQPWLLPHGFKPASAALGNLDGLVISGGDFDIPPSFYGAVARPCCGRTLAARSHFERELCQHALAVDLPLLGICGGMQLLCVVTGGTLYQDLSERAHTDEHQQPHDTSQPFHTVRLTKGSLAAEVYAAPTVQANSTHHQLVHELGPELQATGLAPDGVIEAIEVPHKTFALGLQWHPEVLVQGTPAHLEHLAPYRCLVQAARTRASAVVSG